MKICPKCGIEYDNDKGDCPLCDKEKQEKPSNTNFSMIFFWELYSLFSLTAFLIILVIDLAYTAGLDWSRIPLVSISYSWISIFLIKKMRHKTIYFLILEFTATLITLGLLDSFIPGKPWFFGLAFPVLVAFTLIFNLTYLAVKKFKISLLSTTAAFIASVAIFLLSLELLLHNYYNEILRVSWSLIAFVCLLPLLVFFLYLDKLYKTRRNDFKKYFHF